jgi:DNA-binding transcriptional LysR family regulator
MRISLHQLNVLLAVRQKGSITLAAQELHMTQPAVSNIVKQLEDYYQTKLTKIIQRKTIFTDAGNLLADTAQRINHLLLDTENKIKATQNDLSGDLSVAVVSTAKYFMPRLLAAFKKQHPDIHIKLHVCNRNEILQRLKGKQDDFVIMSQPPKGKRFSIKPFYEDKLVVASSVKSKLNRKKPYNLVELANYDWLMRESGSGTRMVMEKLFKTDKVKPNIVSEVSNNESIKQLIIADMGISIVSLHSIELELENNLISILPVNHFPKKHEWYLIENTQDANKHIIDAFNQFVAEHTNLAHFHSWKDSIT